MIDLEKYFVKQHEGTGIFLKDLYKEENCINILVQLQFKWGAPQPAIAASMLTKRFALMVVSSTLHCMAQYNKVPVYSLDNMRWGSDDFLYTGAGLEYLHLGKTEKLRMNVLHNIFHTKLPPLIQILHQTTRLKQSILWENVAVRINSFYRKINMEECSVEVKRRLMWDKSILQSLPAIDNGEFHPITSYLKLGEELVHQPKRYTCCLYYRLDKHQNKACYCQNCPLSK